MHYKDYLESDHWKRLRKRKLYQSGNKCQLCGSKENLNVHHNTYENRGCEKDEDLVVLCNECHKKHHGISSEIDKIVSGSNTYKTKLFVFKLMSYNEKDLNKFIADNVIELKDIKTNVTDDIYTVLLLYI